MTKHDPFEDYCPLQSFVDRSLPPPGSYSEAEIVDPAPLQSFVDEASTVACAAPPNSSRLESTERFLSALSQIDSVVIFLGDLFVVKAEIGGRPRIAIEKMSPALREVLEANPALLRSPEMLLAAVEEKLHCQTG